MPSYVDSRGTKVHLNREIARGGEGAVYEIQGDYDHVAKIYFKDVSSEKAKKLFLMPGMASKDLLSISAWPTEVLFDKSRGTLKGFVMPRIEGHEIHDLYSPARRKQLFPNADWHFLIHVARNLAAAVDTVHSHGHVIGDLNQKGILLQDEGLLKLIDCDSFQVRYDDTYYLCDVGVRDFTPPELQGKSLHNLIRTCNHDNFGLAVLCFQLLFLGRHPFAGRYNIYGDVPLENAIRKFFFVYSNSPVSKGLEPPPNTLPLVAASAQIAMLFEQVFSMQAASNESRPKAIEWVQALDRLSSELRSCVHNTHHKYHKSLTSCPWCSLELAVGPIFVELGRRPTTEGIGPLNTDYFWQKILNEPSPGPAEFPSFNFGSIVGIPLPKSARFAKYKRLGMRALSLGLLGLALLNLSALESFGVWVLVGLVVMNIVASKYRFDDGGEIVKRKNAEAEAKRNWDRGAKQWLEEAGDSQFRLRLDQLKAKKDEYERLPASYNEERRILENSREEIQKKHFLEMFFIDHADISGIGPNLKAVLASYGVETAYDITQDIERKVPNFGPKRTAELMEWKKKIEARFRYDPSKSLDPDIAALNNKYGMRKRKLEQDLETGAGELQLIRSRVLQKRNDLRKHLEVLAYNLAKASADASLL